MNATNRFPVTATFPTPAWTRLLSVLMAAMLLASTHPLLAQQTTTEERVRTQEQEVQKPAKRLPSNQGSVQHTPKASRDSTTVDPDALTLRTSDGSGKLRFESADGDFKGRIGGRILFDYTAGRVGDDVEPQIGSMEDGTEFRQAWVFTDGSLYDIGYKFQIGMEGAPDIKSMFLEFPSPVPRSKIKVGKFKEDLSLAELTSAKYLTFMARPMLTEFAGGRDLGIRLGGDAGGGDLNYGIGFYRDKTDDALGTSQGDGDYKGTGRVAYVPWNEDGGRKLLHIGTSGSISSLDASEASREAHEPEVHLAPDFVDTNSLNADGSARLGLEFAQVYNSFSVQTEYLQKRYNRVGGSNPVFDSWYVFGSYFLTGEHRSYGGGSFSRVSPNENFRAGEGGGSGAWEIAARYSTMTLNDDVVGGEMRNLTLGVNWYLNPSTRIMANYVLANVDDAVGRTGTDGGGNFFSLRFQIDF